MLLKNRHPRSQSGSQFILESSLLKKRGRGGGGEGRMGASSLKVTHLVTTCYSSFVIKTVEAG